MMYYGCVFLTYLDIHVLQSNVSRVICTTSIVPDITQKCGTSTLVLLPRLDLVISIITSQNNTKSYKVMEMNHTPTALSMPHCQVVM